MVLSHCGLLRCQPDLGQNHGSPKRTKVYTLAPWGMQESVSNERLSGALCWEDKVGVGFSFSPCSRVDWLLYMTVSGQHSK